MNTECELLRPRDLTAPLDVGIDRVYQLLRTNEIPHVTVCGSLRIPRRAWEEWLTEQNLRAKGDHGRMKVEAR